MDMPVWDTSADDFRERFSSLKARLRGMRAGGEECSESAALRTVQEIVEAVRTGGDRALLQFTERFDGCRLTADRLKVTEEEIEAALASVPAQFLGALRLAAERIRRFQEATLPQEPEPVRSGGRYTALRYRPVDSAGVYVPGGTASLASSVLMNAIPAKVAGVPRIAMATPPAADGTVSPDRLAAAHVAGVSEVYRMGGAQAIAALAFGTETVPAVDFIAGPGNLYVILAKKCVYGQVGIDMLPGPSEVVIIADGAANPAWIAADMIAQAEHNPGSAILLTPSAPVARETAEAIAGQIAALPRGEAALGCLTEYGALIRAQTLDECVELANELAPEHLEILTEDPEAVSERVRHAGAIFIGPFSPVAVGDYVAGPSHVLPTGGTARFSSGLCAGDFLKRTSIIRYERDALLRDSAQLAAIAQAEQLEGHARSVSIRLQQEGKGQGEAGG